jgi:hypothetical protein
MSAYIVLLVCGLLFGFLALVVSLAISKGKNSQAIKTLEQEQEDMKAYAKKQSKIAEVAKAIDAYSPTTTSESSARMRALTKRNAERLRKPK